MVCEPQPGHDLHGERRKADPFESPLELADDRGALEFESSWEDRQREREMASHPHGGAQNVQGQGYVVTGHSRLVSEPGALDRTRNSITISIGPSGVT